jgi:Zn finger protein HypA/HybF involved in hydrogenase expression
VRPGWAELLKRVFDLDLGHCPNCGGDQNKLSRAQSLEIQSVEAVEVTVE